MGEKTAARLITTYGDLDNIYAHVDESTPRLREALIAGEGSVRSNAKATRWCATCPSPSTPTRLPLAAGIAAELRRLFEVPGVPGRLWDRLVEATGAGETDATPASPSPGRR